MRFAFDQYISGIENVLARLRAFQRGMTPGEEITLQQIEMLGNILQELVTIYSLIDAPLVWFRIEKGKVLYKKRGDKGRWKILSEELVPVRERIFDEEYVR